MSTCYQYAIFIFIWLGKAEMCNGYHFCINIPKNHESWTRSKGHLIYLETFYYQKKAHKIRKLELEVDHKCIPPPLT